MNQWAEPYIPPRAIRHLKKGRIVIFARGTSNPYFSTDTAATLRALRFTPKSSPSNTRERRNDKIRSKFPDAVMYQKVSYLEFSRRDLASVDSTAIAMCRDNQLPILVSI